MARQSWNVQAGRAVRLRRKRAARALDLELRARQYRRRNHARTDNATHGAVPRARPAAIGAAARMPAMTAAAFRRIALGMSGAVEGAHMGHPDFRTGVGGRIFAT